MKCWASAYALRAPLFYGHNIAVFFFFSFFFFYRFPSVLYYTRRLYYYCNRKKKKTIRIIEPRARLTRRHQRRFCRRPHLNIISYIIRGEFHSSTNFHRRAKLLVTLHHIISYTCNTHVTPYCIIPQ